jgi:hypothetical protein
MVRGCGVKVDRGSIVAGLPLGTAAGLADHGVVLQSDVVDSDLMPWVLLVWPTAVLLAAAAVAAVWRRDVARWSSMAIGAAVGTVCVAAVVVGGISAIAWMISDPGWPGAGALGIPTWMAVAVTASAP